MPDPKSYSFSAVKQGNAIVLVLSPKAAGIVYSSLEIINPEDDRAIVTARELESALCALLP
jgi:hypothetical protein